MAKKDDIGYVYIFTYDQRTVPWSEKGDESVSHKYGNQELRILLA